MAVLQQVERGAVELDAPIGRHLPEPVPGERGQKVTVRTLLNHTSHIADFLPHVFPSVLEGSPASLDANRLRTFAKEELAEPRLGAPPTGEPGTEPGAYSNTNHVFAGLLLEKVTGTRDVIHRAGLRHTSFPRTPHIPGPHSKAYTSLFGAIDPPREPVRHVVGEYGGRRRVDLPCGRFWGKRRGVFGMGTRSASSPDGRRQVSFGINRIWCQRLDENGAVVPHPIDAALGEHTVPALCGPGAAPAKATQAPFPVGVRPAT
ncbi:serine hydrolase domain-containing protein [Nonomuraea sp. SYSU D8015]|uniref:serine hydrolase domain-containing protein n=1 Tax=Nonomuraea sp. SYSU D8015 TaxID=2593644 RepID=UPI001CB7365F|nr:serine hydrolase domain-containing protein [Nonomuraea sp. SYSU D8015]